jgi:hypothetical protein
MEVRGDDFETERAEAEVLVELAAARTGNGLYPQSQNIFSHRLCMRLILLKGGEEEV